MTAVGLVEWSLSDFASGGTGWATKIALGLAGAVVAILVIKFLLQSIKTAMKKFPAAWRYLTLWGRFDGPKKPENVGDAAIYFPLIGLLLGLLLALLNYSLAVYLDGEILSVLLIAVLAAVLALAAMAAAGGVGAGPPAAPARVGIPLPGMLCTSRPQELP